MIEQLLQSFFSQNYSHILSRKALGLDAVIEPLRQFNLTANKQVDSTEQLIKLAHTADEELSKFPLFIIDKCGINAKGRSLTDLILEYEQNILEKINSKEFSDPAKLSNNSEMLEALQIKIKFTNMNKNKQSFYPRKFTVVKKEFENVVKRISELKSHIVYISNDSHHNGSASAIKELDGLPKGEIHSKKS